MKASGNKVDKEEENKAEQRLSVDRPKNHKVSKDKGASKK